MHLRRTTQAAIEQATGVAPCCTRNRIAIICSLAPPWLVSQCRRLTCPRRTSNARATQLARKILDGSRPENERKAIIVAHPQLSLELLKALVVDMPTHDSKEEYRRIPWIWRVTVAAAKRNVLREIKPIVEFTLPAVGHATPRLAGRRHGGWNHQRHRPRRCVAGRADRKNGHRRSGPAGTVGTRTLELAAAMADDPKVFNGTRYDALRIIGVDTWDRRGAQLSRYLKKGKGIDDELVQGAIGGLGTMRSPHVAPAILCGIPHYNQENRGFALDALLKDPQRMSALLDAVESGRVKPRRSRVRLASQS